MVNGLKEEVMKYSAIAIANAIIEKANNGQIDNLTPMKLQKLMFFAQSWYLRTYNQVLFDGEFERWQYGPVLPELYHEFKKFGSGCITKYGENLWKQIDIIDANDPSNKTVFEFLDQIINTYGRYTGTQLSWMTHQPETAWFNGKLGTLIRTDDMIEGKV